MKNESKSESPLIGESQADKSLRLLDEYMATTSDEEKQAVVDKVNELWTKSKPSPVIGERSAEEIIDELKTALQYCHKRMAQAYAEINRLKAKEDSLPTCGDCGHKLTLVRPGKYQCDFCESKEDNKAFGEQENLMSDLLTEYRQLRKRGATYFSIELALCDKFHITRKPE